jgi:hypothetical protein
MAADWRCRTLKVYFSSEKNLTFSVCPKITPAQKTALHNQDIVSLDGELIVATTIRQLSSKNQYLVIEERVKAVCHHLDVNKKQFRDDVMHSSDPDNNGCWIATVDMKVMRRKYRLPPFSKEGGCWWRIVGD